MLVSAEVNGGGAAVRDLPVRYRGAELSAPQEIDQRSAIESRYYAADMFALAFG